VVRIYCLFDRKAREYGPLMLSKNDELIRRIVVDGVRGSKSVHELHPGDFDLMCVGDYGDETGFLSPVTPPILVANLSELLEANA